MLARLVSLRLWLLTAMVTSACVGLAGAAILFANVERANERSDGRGRALAEARAVAAQVRAGAGSAQLRSIQALLVSDELTVERAGRIVFQGSARPGRELEGNVRLAYPGGVITLREFGPAGSGATLALTLITSGVLALVILAAIVASTLVTRSVRKPIARAIKAADRVARGEFNARMGASGPEELTRLGRAFDGMAARLERADADQRQFLADVAHEIATPVNSVSGFALALADGTAETPAQRSEARAVIESETHRLGELLSDLLELTRLDFTEGVRLGTLDLEEFARELSLRFRPAAEAAGIAVELDVEPGTVTIDVRLLETIASNLLSNAIRYTPAGGHVRVRLRERPGELVLAIRDSGVGIAPEHQARIFERLYRVDQTRDRATGGLGLGLAIALRATQTLEGRIELDSILGRGSEFRVTVPLSADAGASVAAATAQASP